MDTAIQLNERGNSKSTLMFIYAIGLGMIFDLLFYENNIGLNYPLYALFFLGGIYMIMKDDESFSFIRFMVFSAVIMYTSSSYARFSFSSVVTILDFFAVPVMFAVLPALSRKDFKEEKRLPLIAVDRFVRSLGGFFFLVEKTFNLSSSAVGTRDRSRTYGIIAGLVLSLLAMVVIIPLMASADMVFNEIMLKITRNMTSGIELERFISHILIIFLVSGYMFGFLGTILNKTEKKSSLDYNPADEAPNMEDTLPYGPVSIGRLSADETAEKLLERKSSKERTDFDSTIPLTVFLCVMNLVFLLFSYIQVKYIILGGTDFLPENITYAEYARSGFFQMMILSVINFSITIFLSSHISRLENTKKLKILLTTLSIFTLIVVFSSYSRMNLYENTYGYTRLRFLVYIILFTEAGLNLMLMYGIWNKSFEFLRYGLLSVLLVFLMLNTVNIDGYIASRNIDRYVETNDIDMDYLLYNLSSDASAEVLRLKDMEIGGQKYYVDKYFENLKDYGTRNLSLFEFNLSDRSAYKNAEEYFETR
ncbi:protein of unknown function [Dethiosulfatibacter aminovorans DSM 17477]|uniref:Uncharacterized protein n=1 Tax=Dethiosulfatibacter aminovorans DSM 17477 TaxID=1121476 RepID=A0A1M6L171_9FIRM|nr:DUF4173 domain-containing protein [Dethiosulfatibacter aminovorans]SHJ64864.1 protein of unknown function [Dethiosulfatibacter aminovorans DSM 17477]